MKEDFLQIIWEQQLFLKDKPLLVADEELKVIKAGFKNQNAGPDFYQSKIFLFGLEWVGSIEIHIKASEWNAHKHQNDEAYQSVILHVVWEKDTEVLRKDGTIVPTIELKNLVPMEILLRYRSLLNEDKTQILCTSFLPSIDAFLMVSMQERVLVERLERKAREILSRFESNNKNWLETFFQSIAWCLGLQINAEPMLVLSQSVPVKILAAQAWNAETIASILLGQAGYLDKVSGQAGQKLKKEYLFYAQKYGLKPPPLLWKLFRLRPSAFPVQRIILLSIICKNMPNWFELIGSAKYNADFFTTNDEATNNQILQDFLKEQGYEKDKFEIGKFLKENLVINVFTPFLTAMGLYQNQPELIERSLDWVNEMKAEPNKITKMWEAENQTISTAGQSQALNELYKNYCLPKRCMECNIGTAILRSGN